jgi:hypothetical protein
VKYELIYGAIPLEKLTRPLLVNNSSHFITNEGSLPHSQDLAICLYPVLGKYNPHNPITFPDDLF